MVAEEQSRALLQGVEVRHPQPVVPNPPYVGDGLCSRNAAAPDAIATTETPRPINAFDSETTRGVSTDPPSRGVALPERIGRFFVLRRLGGGGFGEVFLATDSDTGSHVAIKIPRDGHLVTEELIQGFLSEARLVAQLQHPLIVRVRDFLRLDTYGCCVVMQYIDGGSLHDLLKRVPVSYEDTAKLIADVAETLHDAHRRKIYHRDIKPANILLDGEGRPHLTDFGLALLDDDRWLHRDELAGTCAYMSPEQVLRQVQFIDSRTDIWSLGVILYELLTRERPFRGPTHEQLFQEILQKRPNPRVVEARIPMALERICTKCLERDLNCRYTTALDLAFELRAWLTSQGRQDASETATSCPIPADRWSLQLEQAASVASDVGVTSPNIRDWHRYLALVIVMVGLAGVMLAASLLRTSHSPVPSAARDTLDQTPVVPPPGTDFISLLDREPVMVSWLSGDGREPPRFDDREQRYVVRSERTRWIARVRETASRSMELRAVISVDNWLGFAGLVWALREEPSDTSERCYRCLAVEYYRISAAEPARLNVVEMVLSEQSRNDMRITHTRDIAVREIVPPESSEASLELSIEPHRLSVRFDRCEDWEPVDPLGKTDWLPDGRTAVGLTGQGRDTVIRGFCLRYLPHMKDSLP